MKDGTRLDRAELVGRALYIVRDVLRSKIWEARHLDPRAYVRVQRRESGALRAGAFRRVDAPRPDAILTKEDLNDLQCSLNLLRESDPIRHALLGEHESRLRDLKTLVAARNRWAHMELISLGLAKQTLNSAQHLLEGLSAFRAAEEIAALRERPPAVQQRRLAQRARALSERERRLTADEASLCKREQRVAQRERRNAERGRRMIPLDAATALGLAAFLALLSRTR